MRIANVCGVLLLLAGCNLLPDPVGDDSGLRADDGIDGGFAGAGEVHNETASASPYDYDRSACELEAKKCYASGKDDAPCAAILKHCLPPPVHVPAPCGEDCDAEMRSCFAKGIDANTCDQRYHACLSPKPSNGSESGDPVTDCLMAAKSCYAKGEDPAVCDALVADCVPNAGDAGAGDAAAPK